MEVARTSRLAKPSYDLFVTGVALTVIGAISFGFAIGRRRRAASTG